MADKPDDSADGIAKVRWALAILREQFDCGLILVSRDQEDGGTGRVFVGFGNCFAQAGMARAYLREDYVDAEPELLVEE